MTDTSPAEMASALGKGLLSFPVTTFHADGSFDPEGYRENIAWACSHGPAGLFVGGGTGEFFSLTPAEVAGVVKIAVAEVGRRLPLIAPCGYGTEMAKELARNAEDAGADGLLLMPPYLTEFEREGIAAHVEAVCRATRLGVIFYSRASATIDEVTLARLCDRCPNLVGFKDGVGDIEMMTRIYARLGGRLTYLGGLPTAETFALPYLELGVNTYSSAIYNFLPKFALDFHAAVRRRDHTAVYAALREFVLPYIAIRHRRKGYAVSIVKAGMRLVGRDCGPVRPPLTDLTPHEMDELAVLVSGRN
ncbi:MAG: 5-dehydro-4-deoxyglucarate dehydratase [Gammaproteobacteria bacterium]|nr:5-dehydro-4-deoxyglucarate dehydratase [Gammaproteobacteria bacterium]